MRMTKGEFQTKIGAIEIVYIGRYSCRKEGRDYCFYGESAEIFQSFNELWERVHSFILYGVNYSEDRGSKKVDNLPTLDYDPQQFNSMGGYEESTIANYYGQGQDLEIRYDSHPKAVIIDSLAIKHKM